MVEEPKEITDKDAFPSLESIVPFLSVSPISLFINYVERWVLYRDCKRNLGCATKELIRGMQFFF